MSHPDHPDAAGAQAKGQPNGDAQGQPTRETDTKRGGTAMTEPDPATTTDLDPVTYEASLVSTAGGKATLVTGMAYVWWLLIGGTFEILFGGMYLGSPQATQIDVTTAWAELLYVVLGVYMVTIGFGILRQERWAYWGGWLGSLGIAAVSIDEIVRWATGTPITLETAFFAALNVLFCLYNVYFLLQPDTRKALQHAAFKGSPFAPGLALCGIALATPALAITLFVQHIHKDLATPGLLLAYLLGSVLVMVMAFMALRLPRWVWWGDFAWALVLTGLSIYFIAHELADVILPQNSSSSADTQGLIFSGVNLLFALMVVYLLFLDGVRGAVFGAHEKHPLFSPRTLIAGLSLAVFALVIYLLPGELGKAAIAHTVFGLVMGTVVGLLPGADPANRISAYFAGLLLAFASYVARGGLLPYTKYSSAIVVLLMLVVVTGITAVVRSRAWFVLMLLGVASMYGLAELQFQAAPAAYLASAGLALVGIFLGFSLGFTVSSLLDLELVAQTAEPKAGTR